MEEDDLQRIADKKIDLLLYADSVKSNQDINCPKIFWNGWGHGSGIGDWCCVLREYHYGDLLHGGGSENKDYYPCNCRDYNTCPILSDYNSKKE